MLETAHDLVNLLRRARRALLAGPAEDGRSAGVTSGTSTLNPAPEVLDIAAGLDDAIRQIRPLAMYASEGETGAGYDFLTDEPRHTDLRHT